MSADAEIALERELLASGLGQAEVAEGQVPVIDLRVEDAAERMWDAATTVGFFLVTGHAIPSAVIDGAFASAKEFFGQDVAAKESQSPFAGNLNSGYEYLKQVRPSTGTVDQKESIQVTTRQSAMQGRWPSSPSCFKDSACDLALSAHNVAKTILDMLEPKACPQLPPGTLAAANNIWSEESQCTLRLLHYPPIDEATQAKLSAGAAKGEQHWRAGPHTDWCCITLLFQRPGEAGLECAPNPRADDPRWLAVDPVEGAIAVNIGDMLARWSDGRVLSNLHRVRLPINRSDMGRSRYSIAFFAQADKNAVIESTQHDPVTAGDYIFGRIRSNFQALKSIQSSAAAQR